MKALVFIAVLMVTFASPSVELEALGIGQSCNSNGGFTVQSFNVSPYPPTACSPQAVTMAGVFTVAACPTQIHLNENYNQRQSYNQNIPESGCYTAGQSASYNFTVNTIQCNSGSYQIQVTLQIQGQGTQQNLACWQYQYQL